MSAKSCAALQLNNALGATTLHFNCGAQPLSCSPRPSATPPSRGPGGQDTFIPFQMSSFLSKGLCPSSWSWSGVCFAMVFLKAFLFQVNQNCLIGFICIWIKTPVLGTENQTYNALDLPFYTKWLLCRLLWAPFMQQLNLYHLRRQSEHRPKDDKFWIIGPSDPRTIAMARKCGELFICFIVVGLWSISTATVIYFLWPTLSFPPLWLPRDLFYF